jgi:molecular chaperone GrpE
MSSPKIGPVSAMETELEKLRVEANQLNNDYMRALADFDNFRKRKERELQEFREFANEQLLQELVPVLDNFERAVRAAEAMNEKVGTGGGSESLRKGIRLIFNQLQEALGRFGFQSYSCVGETFDPRRCEAVNFQEQDDQPDNTVIAESARGYTYRTRVLRPAMVVVTKARSGGGQSPSEEKSDSDETPDAKKEASSGERL